MIDLIAKSMHTSHLKREYKFAQRDEFLKTVIQFLVPSAQTQNNNNNSGGANNSSNNTAPKDPKELARLMAEISDAMRSLGLTAASNLM